MDNHNHHSHCMHANLKYCSVCNLAYCTDCGYEFTRQYTYSTIKYEPNTGTYWNSVQDTPMTSRSSNKTFTDSHSGHIRD